MDDPRNKSTTLRGSDGKDKAGATNSAIIISGSANTGVVNKQISPQADTNDASALPAAGDSKLSKLCSSITGSTKVLSSELYSVNKNACRENIASADGRESNFITMKYTENPAASASEKPSVVSQSFENRSEVENTDSKCQKSVPTEHNDERNIARQAVVLQNLAYQSISQSTGTAIATIGTTEEPLYENVNQIVVIEGIKKEEEVFATLVELSDPAPPAHVYPPGSNLDHLNPPDGLSDPSNMLKLLVERNGNLQNLPEGTEGHQYGFEKYDWGIDLHKRIPFATLNFRGHAFVRYRLLSIGEMCPVPVMMRSVCDLLDNLHEIPYFLEAYLPCIMFLFPSIWSSISSKF